MIQWLGQEAVVKLFEDSRSLERAYQHIAEIISSLYGKGYDFSETLINQLLMANSSSSFVIESGMAVPHLILEEGESKFGWFRFPRGVRSERFPQDNPVYVMFAAFGRSDDVEKAIGYVCDISYSPLFRKAVACCENTNELREVLSCVHEDIPYPWYIVSRGLGPTFGNRHVMSVCVSNRRGLHARAAAKVVKLSATFDSIIFIRKGESIADSRSILALMMLGAGPGTDLEIIAEGAEADEAGQVLGALFKARFEED